MSVGVDFYRVLTDRSVSEPLSTRCSVKVSVVIELSTTHDWIYRLSGVGVYRFCV
jgi:hypothetical protein